jgi:hypothetical protein
MGYNNDTFKNINGSFNANDQLVKMPRRIGRRLD